MAIPKSQREEGKLKVVTASRELAAHTIRICSNEKVFPKHYRWCITSKIVDTAIDICSNIDKANAIYVSDKNDYPLRKSYQNQALADTYSLLTLVDIAYVTFGIESSKIEYWTRLITSVQKMIRSWKKSDSDRYSKM
jgi:hypothetical protein